MDNIMSYQITSNGINYYFAKVGNGRPFFHGVDQRFTSVDDEEYMENEFKNLEFLGLLDEEIEEANHEEDSLEIELSFR